MSLSRTTIRQALTIARRDFIATVFTPMFLFFLLAPLIMVAFSLVGGLGASSVAEGTNDHEQLVVIADARDAQRVFQADSKLRLLFPSGARPPPITVMAPQRNSVAEARATLDASDHDVGAALAGPFDAPHIFYASGNARSANYLAALSEAVVNFSRVADRATRIEVGRQRSTLTGRHTAGFVAVFGVFFLTLLLAGQAVGTMAEERSNKVIEILAAAVPLESVFFGKLLGMFGSALLFIFFWGTIAAEVGHVLPPDYAHAIAMLKPAVGWPMFIVLFGLYFTFAYLLLGSVFLMIGAQATTIREIQMMSLPITFTQIGMFALASAAAAHPDQWIARAAEIFPLSSPFAMAARAANTAGLGWHAAALVWQAIWVGLMIALGARWFRRGVLKSGGPRRKKAAAPR